MSPAPLASIWARSLGHSILGATRRRSVSPKFFIARAADPTFSPIWVWDRMMAGGIIWRFDGCGFSGITAPRYIPSRSKFRAHFKENESDGKDQGCQSGGRAGRRRDDPHHLGPDQEKAGPALSGHRPALLRSFRRESRC